MVEAENMPTEPAAVQHTWLAIFDATNQSNT